MLLEGSCHCRAVRFSVVSNHPYPFMRCYCSICRKTAGAGGYAINIAGDNRTLLVEGEENIAVYNARIQNPEDNEPHISRGERRFCRRCGSFLWVYDPDHPDLMHPFASAIDTDLPKPPSTPTSCLALQHLGSSFRSKRTTAVIPAIPINR